MKSTLAAYQDALQALVAVITALQEALRTRALDQVFAQTEALEQVTANADRARLDLYEALQRLGVAGLLSYRDRLPRTAAERQDVDQAIQLTLRVQHELKVLRKLVAIDRSCCNRLARVLGLTPLGSENAGTLLNRQA